jgi:hypothetical protein
VRAPFFWKKLLYQKNKTSSGVETLICLCTRKASGSTEDSCEGAQPQNLTSWEEDVTDPFCHQSSEQPPGKGLAPRPHPENPVGNSVQPDRFSAPRSN